MNTGKNIKSIYVLIVFGILLAIGCTTIVIINPVSKPVNILNLIFIIIQAGIGLATAILAKKVTKKFFDFFMGLLYLSWSLIYLIAYTMFDFQFKEMWPLLGVSAGILWFVAGWWKYRTLKFGYLIPSVTLFGMGCWYSLFSFGLIKLSFEMVASTLGPLFMLLIAVFLIVFFYAQQRHKELVFPDDSSLENIFKKQVILFNLVFFSQDDIITLRQTRNLIFNNRVNTVNRLVCCSYSI